MKQVASVAFALAIWVVLHGSALAQELEQRYRVVYVHSSQSSVSQRSATFVTVVNQSSGSCRVLVEWFDERSPTPVCAATTNLAVDQSASFCTRALPNGISNCSVPCTPALVGNISGTAIVSSSVGSVCSAIAVDARVYYMTAGDAAIAAISNPKIVFFGEGNLGD
jgi:hypothetical protein